MKYPTYPVLIENVKFRGYPNAGLYLTRFAERDLPALMIGNEETQEVYAICNLNPAGMYELKEFEFAVKDYSENEGMMEWMIENGLLEPAHDAYPSYWVSVPICRATPKLQRLIKEACANYERTRTFEEELDGLEEW